jgi:predicted Zn-dependent protease
MAFNISIFRALWLVASWLSVASLQAQDDVVLKALQDEVQSNIKGLKLADHEKPFFIMYNLHEQKSYSIAASLGALSASDENSQRAKSNARILVGDYEFNDESLEDNLFSRLTAIEINLPVEDDYFGIRRAYWSTTDKVYRDAARHFERHKETLKELGKPLNDVPHRSFAKSNSVQIISTLKPYTFDKTKLEIEARNLSARFLNHPDIVHSGVAIQYTEGYDYLVNSEGTVAKIPFTLALFIAVVQNKNAGGEFALQQITHMAKTPEGFPTAQQLATEIEKMISKAEGQFALPKFDEEYSGPVLLTGKVVAELFSYELLKGKESIIAKHDIPKLDGYQYDNKTSVNEKIGKSFCNESITVKAKPKLKSFNNIDLLGSFDIDNEGIVPADELTVIENGVLKNLLNDRTITHSSHKANGFSSGAGVLEITSSMKDSEKALKDKLIAQAKKEGLDYAMILREENDQQVGLFGVYKVSVADGKEVLVKNASLGQISPKALKRILGASEKYTAHNLVSGRGADLSHAVPDITSFIVPEYLLLEELEMAPSRMPTLNQEEYVSSPLKY